jgi:polyhydroxyalkanoic acid synthase PhaR subunit
MATASPTTPPLPTWKHVYDRTEAFWTGPLQALLGSESYMTAASVLREASLTRHKVTRETLDAYWETMRLPSMVDHARLAGQVVQLEHKVELLHDRLDAIGQQLEALLAAVNGARADDHRRAGKPKPPAEA